MDARVFLISASYVSQSRLDALAEALVAAAPCRAVAIRLESSGDRLWRALDAMSAEGASRIEVRPIGLPFSQSLETWLPGAVGSWLAQLGETGPEVFLAAAPHADARAVQTAACAQVPLTAIRPQPRGEMGKGWDAPPVHRHHLLVCTGPRCHLRDAPSLLDALKAELGRAGLAGACLVTSTGCLFPCNAGPVLVHYPRGLWYRIASLTDLQGFVATALVAGQIPHGLRIPHTGDLCESA